MIHRTNPPQIMGILNVTPDSFSDGGRFLAPGQAIERALAMVEEGAGIIDVGGESTRPGSAGVSLQEELDRVIPVVEAIASRVNALISVDTSKPEVMRAACVAGAGMINDVFALQAPGALAVAAGTGAQVCLMHMQGEPRSMQVDPRYDDVVAEVRDFLAARVAACLEAGIREDRLVLDPGFGFGKTHAHNLTLMNHLSALAVNGLPLLVGVSRKSMIGKMLGDDRPPRERVTGSVAAALLAAQRGARILRVHDVGATRDALRVLAALG
ncbi:dihydropteroate synthase [Ectothiorhodospira lacustris]|uniref:dihydropteroate synthase n=1 Tax=Ectothiorhodospira lacustris TaxID=2899127 RepID=UPI001EE96E55|nr:dihydropteroate synthase [Ectothiorhodospira lacustris]MCG5501544.1 dihydropteroate synthase [Ectothiorhodospira lacustris]MCG5508684.1 dihydropteroate synthase [Ectothiorhodospira lacustris]MCG5520475.1 dihydropteroate synthase [Ectothiorhodospira lacustris]